MSDVKDPFLEFRGVQGWSMFQVPEIKQSFFSKDHDNILCNHCKRSPTNGIRCLGMCVADNDY